MSAAQQKELNIVSAERILGAALLTPPLSLNPQTRPHIEALVIQPLTCRHDRILVDLRSGGEDVPADLGQADGGHHAGQQPVQQQQVQHPRSQGRDTRRLSGSVG